MKAIQKTSGVDFNLLHTKVIEVHSDNPKYRRFKCLRCGAEWKDCTTSPILIDEEIAKNLKDYYPNYRNCITE